MHPAKFKYAKKKKANKIVIKIAKKKHNSNKQFKSDFFLTAKHYTIQSEKNSNNQKFIMFQKVAIKHKKKVWLVTEKKGRLTVLTAAVKNNDVLLTAFTSIVD